VLIPNYSMNISGFTFVGEAALMLWLLIKGSRKDFNGSDTDRPLQADRDTLVNTPGG
jgi:hypothetical protein